MSFLKSAFKGILEAPPEENVTYKPGVFKGSQGCVFVPSLIVDGATKDQTKKYITKIFIDDTLYSHEKSVNAFVKQVDPHSYFTNVNYNESPINLSKITDTDIQKCGEIIKTRDTLVTKKFINYEYLGQSFSTIIKEKTPLTIGNVEDIFSAFPTLIDKILLMNNGTFGKKIFHSDIHPGNVMFDFSRHKVYLIDFGAANVDIQGDPMYDPLSLLITISKLLNYIRTLPIATSFMGKKVMAIQTFTTFVTANKIGDLKEQQKYAKNYTVQDVVAQIKALSLALVSKGGKRKTLRHHAKRKTLRRRKVS